MSKHTPGPWAVEVGDSNSDWPRQWPTIHAKDYEVVGTEGLYGDLETDMANARLIAAAPDLLEALQQSIAALDLYKAYGWPDRLDLIGKARAAIDRATGEQQ